MAVFRAFVGNCIYFEILTISKYEVGYILILCLK